MITDHEIQQGIKSLLSACFYNIGDFRNYHNSYNIASTITTPIPTSSYNLPNRNIKPNPTTMWSQKNVVSRVVVPKLNRDTMAHSAIFYNGGRGKENMYVRMSVTNIKLNQLKGKARFHTFAPRRTNQSPITPLFNYRSHKLNCYWPFLDTDARTLHVYCY